MRACLTEPLHCQICSICIRALYQDSSMCIAEYLDGYLDTHLTLMAGKEEPGCFGRTSTVCLL